MSLPAGLLAFLIWQAGGFPKEKVGVAVIYENKPSASIFNRVTSLWSKGGAFDFHIIGVLPYVRVLGSSWEVLKRVLKLRYQVFNVNF